MSHNSYSLSDWQGYLTHNEIEVIKNCVKKIKTKEPVCVNIGAGAGTSTLAMLEASDNSIVFSVDILTTGSEATTNEHLRINESEYADTGRVIKIWGDSKIVGKRFPMEVDLVFVDGDHLKAGIEGDLVWFEHLKMGGFILFHDYGSPNWPDVKIAVDEFARQLGVTPIAQVDTIIAFQV